MNRRMIALVLVASMMLCGCNTQGINSVSADDAQVELEKTITADSKWINSSIPGAIDENTNVRAQDDFYTYVNKDLILSTKLENDYGDFFLHADDLVKKRKIMIVSGEEDNEANKEVLMDIPDGYVEHDEELLERFVAALTDWDERNNVGRKPLEEYIDAIRNISDISQMTDYILDKDGTNFTNDSLISMEVKALKAEDVKYSVVLGRTTEYLLESRDEYTNIDMTGIKMDHIVEEEVKCALGELGYSEAEAENILTNCYKFESKLADASLPDFITSKAEALVLDECYMSYEQLEKLQGNYPLCALLDIYGFNRESDYYVPYDDFVRNVGKLYCESNLEFIKAYYMVHTIHEAMSLLDKDAYDLAMKYEANLTTETKVEIADSEGDSRKIEINDEWDRILQKYVAKYLGEPLEIVYLARYCSAEEKEYLTDLTDDLIESYVEIINGEEWMDDASKETVLEKLSYMKKHILYPEYFDDYSDLKFEEDDTLVDMVQKAKKSSLRHVAQKAGKSIESGDWDINEYPSTTVNAYYVPKENAIYILAGAMATGDVFDLEEPYEYNLGKIGAIVGHEISHGFDKNGMCFDKYGNYVGLVQSSMGAALFAERTRKLEKFYDSIPAAPGMGNLSGTKLENEAIADMGGIKAGIMAGERAENFDFDLFFRSFAQLWGCKETYADVVLSAKSDTHPRPFLRTNVTLSQYEKFYETYGIKEGDGMYVTKEDRIAVW